MLVCVQSVKSEVVKKIGEEGVGIVFKKATNATPSSHLFFTDPSIGKKEKKKRVRVR